MMVNILRVESNFEFFSSVFKVNAYADVIHVGNRCFKVTINPYNTTVQQLDTRGGERLLKFSNKKIQQLLQEKEVQT